MNIAPAFVKNYRAAIEKGIKPDDLNSNKTIIPDEVYSDGKLISMRNLVNFMLSKQTKRKLKC